MDYTPLFTFTLCSLSSTLVAESHTGVIPDLYRVFESSPPLSLSLWLRLLSLLFSVSLLYIEGLSLIPCLHRKSHLITAAPENAYKIQASLCVCRNGVTIVQSLDCLLWETTLRISLPHCASLSKVQSWGLAREQFILFVTFRLCVHFYNKTVQEQEFRSQDYLLKKWCFITANFLKWMLHQKQPMNWICPSPLDTLHVHSVEIHFSTLIIHTEPHLSQDKKGNGNDCLEWKVEIGNFMRLNHSVGVMCHTEDWWLIYSSK